MIYEAVQPRLAFYFRMVSWSLIQGSCFKVVFAEMAVSYLLIVGNYEEATNYHYKLLDAAQISKGIQEGIYFAGVS